VVENRLVYELTEIAMKLATAWSMTLFIV